MELPPSLVAKILLANEHAGGIKANILWKSVPAILDMRLNGMPVSYACQEPSSARCKLLHMIHILSLTVSLGR